MFRLCHRLVLLNDSSFPFVYVVILTTKFCGEGIWTICRTKDHGASADSLDTTTIRSKSTLKIKKAL